MRYADHRHSSFPPKRAHLPPRLPLSLLSLNARRCSPHTPALVCLFLVSFPLVVLPLASLCCSVVAPGDHLDLLLSPPLVLYPRYLFFPCFTIENQSNAALLSISLSSSPATATCLRSSCRCIRSLFCSIRILRIKQPPESVRRYPRIKI